MGGKILRSAQNDMETNGEEVNMTVESLTSEEKRILLRLAREAMEFGVRGEKLLPLDKTSLSSRLMEKGASFVTLTVRGQLRGCIGALEDPRFPPVSERELNGISIEVSRLTRPVPLEYKDANDLLSKLRPHVDGVILKDGYHRATFLPQVWEKIPDPAKFLDNLCYKMGVRDDQWRVKHLDVLIYQVEEFHE